MGSFLMIKNGSFLGVGARFFAVNVKIAWIVPSLIA